MDFVYPDHDAETSRGNWLKEGMFPIANTNINNVNNKPNKENTREEKEPTNHVNTTTIYIIGIIGIIPACGALAWALRSFIKRNRNRCKRQPSETSGERLNGLVSCSNDLDRPLDEADSPIGGSSRLAGQHTNNNNNPFGNPSMSNILGDAQQIGYRKPSESSNDFRPTDHRMLFKRLVSSK
jgi:hypothetical protein